jgi:hypothetical protein
MNDDTEPDKVVFVYPTFIGVYRRKSAVPKTSRNGTFLTDCGVGDGWMTNQGGTEDTENEWRKELRFENAALRMRLAQAVLRSQLSNPHSSVISVPPWFYK